MKSLYEDLIKVREKTIKEALEGFTTKTRELLPKIPKRSPGPQLKAMLKNNGVTDDEIRYLKLDDVLAKDMVTKDEIAGHLESNGVPFHDTDYAKEKGARYQQYALQGGKNYGEKIVHYSPEGERKPVEVEWDKLEKPEYIKTEEQHNGYKPGSDRSGRWNPPELPIAEVIVEEGPKNYGGFLVIGRVKDKDRNPYQDESSRRWKRVYEATCSSDEQKEKCVVEAKKACIDQLTRYDTMDNPDPNDYKSRHWDGTSNYLFHVRHQEFEDADGKNLWLIEEIQSDLHQDARKKGYSKGSSYAVHNATGSRVLKPGGQQGAVYDKKEEADDYASKNQGWYVKEIPGDGLPNSPMKKSWEENAFKYALQQAIKAGADRIGWVTGEISADRFDISKQVDKIRLVNMAAKYPNQWHMKSTTQLPGSPWKAEKPFMIFAYNDDKLVVSKETDEDKIDDVIGKEVAKKLLDQPESDNERVLSGELLKVGGEGMKAAYDQRIPSIAKKIAKAGGSTVGKVTLPDAEDEGEEVDPYEAMDLQVKMGFKDSIHGNFIEDENEEEPGPESKWYLVFDNDIQEGPFDNKEDADAARERMVTIREGQKGHEVWYMDITPGIKDLVSKGLRLALESVAPSDWYVVKDAT